jgi:arabinose-5-phosphate isomerase
LIALTGDRGSSLARLADVTLDVGIDREACSLGLAPTASTTAAAAMGDALAVSVAERRGFSEQDFAELHPGGKLGKRLTPVRRLMHTGDAVPRVKPDAVFHDVVYEMSRKGFGVTSVVDDGGHVVGIISDGDLRRLFEKHGRKAVDLRAAEYMTANPITISPDELAPAALRVMETRKITSLLVAEGQRLLLGLVHLHDLWTTQLI